MIILLNIKIFVSENSQVCNKFNSQKIIWFHIFGNVFLRERKTQNFSVYVGVQCYLVMRDERVNKRIRESD